jgi:hypothetical protein
MAKAFGGGVGGSKCLCGAVSGGVMALGWNGKSQGGNWSRRSEHIRLPAASPSKPTNGKAEHSQCRKITEETAEIVERLLKNKPDGILLHRGATIVAPASRGIGALGLFGLPVESA